MTNTQPSAPSPEMLQLRASLAAIDSGNYQAPFHWSGWTSIRHLEQVKAKTQFLADYTIYLLERIERLEQKN